MAKNRIPNALMYEYPDTTAQPCSDCPWRRNATPEWLGPFLPLDWIKIAHGESAVACHQTIVTEPGETRGDWEHPGMRQCRGLAIFRANVGKNPKNPTVVTGPRGEGNCFETNEEFLEYHGHTGEFAPLDLYSPLSTGDDGP